MVSRQVRQRASVFIGAPLILIVLLLAAKKVGTFIKKTAGKIAKFGLKVVATVAEVGAKVIGFIPGGKAIGKAVEGFAKGANMLSDKIHANLGAKLEKGMKVMDKVDKVVGYIPRDLSAEEGFQRRDGIYYF